jgi:type I restriction enzyme, S subunit
MISLEHAKLFKSRHFVPEGGKPLIRIRDIFNDRTAVEYAGDYDPRYLVQPDELLVGMDGDFNCARWRGPEGLLNQRVCKITPHPEQLDLDFLTHLLPGYLQAIHDLTSSTTVTHLSSRDVAQIPIPVPPLAEQQELAQLFGRAVGKQHSSIAHVLTARRSIERFRRAVLAAACSGRLTAEWRAENAVTVNGQDSHLPPRWRWTTFGRVCERVTVGYVSKMVNEYRPDGVPFLRSLNVRELRFEPKDLKFISREFHQRLSKSALRPGDIVVVRSGFVGTACVIPPELGDANCSDLVIARPGPNLVPEYGAIYVNAPQMKAHVSDVKVGSAQAHFNTRSMQAAPLLLPPVAEQHEIASRVKKLLAVADGLRGRIDAASRRVELSSQAVLAKAFRGDLVGAEP